MENFTHLRSAKLLFCGKASKLKLCTPFVVILIHENFDIAHGYIKSLDVKKTSFGLFTAFKKYLMLLTTFFWIAYDLKAFTVRGSMPV